jgi:signal transduction histidine kinase
VNLEADPNQRTLWADPNQIRQVLINLLNNAIHATDEEGEITVRLQSTDTGASMDIIDSGTGIPKENLDRIFEPFFSTKAPGKGTGLGLFVSRDIVEKFGGKLTVEEQVGAKGLALKSTYPIKIALAMMNLASSNQSFKKEMVTMIHVPTNILLVDDEKDFVEMLSMRLEDAGDKVTPAYDGSMCLEKLKETPIDVVILDIKMPGMDGIQALREIKSRYPLVEVILLTGHGTTETAVQGMKLGAFDYLLKPADFEELKTILDRAKQRKAEQDERIRKAEARQLLRKGGNI